MSILEDIQKEFEIPKAYENWAAYRGALTDIILAHSPEEGGSIALFGIGPANDLDLGRLATRYERMTLIDVDAAGMRRGLERYGLLHSPKIRLWTGSLTGVAPADTEAFFMALLQFVQKNGRSLTEAAFMDASLEELAKLRAKVYRSSEALRKALPEEHYDLSVSVGLHSQFWSILSYSWLTLAANVEEQLLGHAMNHDPFFEALRSIDDLFIPVFNATLAAMSKTILFGVEDAPSDPVEGAYQSLTYIRQLYPEVKEQHLHWPFRPEDGKEYDMLLQFVECVAHASEDGKHAEEQQRSKERRVQRM